MVMCKKLEIVNPKAGQLVFDPSTLKAPYSPVYLASLAAETFPVPK